MHRRLVLIGPPGAGKGTQAKLLAEKLRVKHIASGDLFRKHQERGTALGLEAQAYMRRGQLVPDEVTISMVLQELRSMNEQQAYLLDGFPRNVTQAKALDRGVRGKGLEVERTLYIQVPEEESVRRLSSRVVCRRCQTPYQWERFPLRPTDRCERCGGELYRREDDSPEAVRVRLGVYRSETEPLVDYYRQQSRLLEVDGVGTVEEVQGRLQEALGCGSGIAH